MPEGGHRFQKEAKGWARAVTGLGRVCRWGRRSEVEHWAGGGMTGFQGIGTPLKGSESVGALGPSKFRGTAPANNVFPPFLRDWGRFRKGGERELTLVRVRASAFVPGTCKVGGCNWQNIFRGANCGNHQPGGKTARRGAGQGYVKQDPIWQ